MGQPAPFLPAPGVSWGVSSGGQDSCSTPRQSKGTNSCIQHFSCCRLGFPRCAATTVLADDGRPHLLHAAKCQQADMLCLQILLQVQSLNASTPKSERYRGLVDGLQGITQRCGWRVRTATNIWLQKCTAKASSAC